MNVELTYSDCTKEGSAKIQHFYLEPGSTVNSMYEFLDRKDDDKIIMISI